MLGYLTIGVFEPLGRVYPVFGIHTAMFELVWSLGLVFKLLELVYLVVLYISALGYLTIGVFEPLGQVYPVFGIHTAVFKLVWPLGLAFKLLELVYVVVLNIELKHELEFGLRGLPHLVSKCPGFSHVAVLVFGLALKFTMLVYSVALVSQLSMLVYPLANDPVVFVYRLLMVVRSRRAVVEAAAIELSAVRVLVVVAVAVVTVISYWPGLG